MMDNDFDSVQMEIIKANIAFLKGQAISNGDWAKWEASQKEIQHLQRPFHYILNDQHEPISVSLEEYSNWMRNPNNNIVAITQITPSVRVSTVFLSINHNFSNSGAPILFETMIFGGKYDGYLHRYCTWDESVLGHDSYVRILREVMDVQ